MEELNYTINQQDLTDIYKTLRKMMQNTHYFQMSTEQILV